MSKTRDLADIFASGGDAEINGLTVGRGGGNDVQNTAVGIFALRDNTTGRLNTALGTESLLKNTLGDRNTGVGFRALEENIDASYNTGLGMYALRENVSGGTNTAVGYHAMLNNTTGGANVAVGYEALKDATTGLGNTIIGRNAGRDITTGSRNTIIGRFNGNTNGLDIRTSDNNIVLSDGDGNPRCFYNNSINAWVFSNDNSKDGYWPKRISVSAQNAVTVDGNGGFVGITGAASSTFYLNRNSSDGDLIRFYSEGNEEGSISVSGTTVSYNGGHLSRWSRLPDDSKDAVIVKGTVLTNLDEMVEWGDEDNEQLNKMEVSYVEGDTNVAGVFVNWDEDDDWNDMNVAMTGDMVIRIAQDTTVQRGDLLVSAGDGTAKPQDDDIVRSKTIAKVTSTRVSHTYDDGSYLVPCVLMAC